MIASLGISNTDILQSAGRVLDVLLCFNQQAEWSIAELSEELELHKSVVRRCVVTLVSRGFLTQNPVDKRFRLGLVLAELGLAISPMEELAEIAKPFMRKLSRKTMASVFLTARAEEQAICIARVDSPKPLRVTFEVGRRSALHAGASAQAILAYLPDCEIDSIVQMGLASFTEKTLIDRDLLLSSLDRVRKLGYAISSGELDEGVTAIGVPIMGRNGEILASLSISGPSTDFTLERKEFLVEATRDTAFAIQNIFGNKTKERTSYETS